MTELSLLRVTLKFLRQLWRNVRDNQRAFAFVPQLEYMTNPMNFGDQRRLACRNAETGAQSPRTERILQGLHEPVHAFAGPRRDRYACRISFRVGLGQLTIGEIVDLIEDDQRLLPECIKFLNHALDRFHLIIHPRMTKIDNVNEEIGLAHFFQRRFVALKDSINVCGSFRKNPTVSVSSTRCLFGKTKLRVVGSSVAKSLFSVTRSAPVSKFKRVDLPALV